MVIAIDGFSSTGKSSLAKRLANEFHFLYVDTGAMYRMVALKVLKSNWLSVDGEVNEELLKQGLRSISIDFNSSCKGENRAMLDGEMVENDIRSMDVNSVVSRISSLSIVRKQLVKQQQNMSLGRDLVMDGRDIGTVVFPNADLKIFMKANDDIRAERRLKELRSNGNLEVSFDQVKNNLIQRDRDDQAREDSPLIQAEGARVIDNSRQSEDDVFQLVSSWVRKIDNN